MVVPLYGRIIAAAVGVLLIGFAGASVIGTLMVPRAAGGRLTPWVDWLVNAAFRMLIARIRSYRRRDRVLASQAAVLLVCQLIAWLGVFYVGFSLLIWPFAPSGLTRAFDTAGPALWSDSASAVHGASGMAIQYCAAVTGIVTITLQIAYLPTLYAAFNRRETEVALLNARAGVPSWGPELLARTHYALGSGMSTIDTLPDLYRQWERWAADVAESHTTYLPLVRFRSPRPLSSWVTALLAVLDSAALYLALSPRAAPSVAARLCLRGGFRCFIEVAHGMGLKVIDTPDPSKGISVSYDDFLEAVARMKSVNFPIEREPADAWPDFVGWRVNYEEAAYAIAYALDAVPALWSGPRRHPTAPIAPLRPPPGRAAQGPASQGPAAQGPASPRPASPRPASQRPASRGPARTGQVTPRCRHAAGADRHPGSAPPRPLLRPHLRDELAFVEPLWVAPEFAAPEFGEPAFLAEPAFPATSGAVARNTSSANFRWLASSCSAKS